MLHERINLEDLKKYESIKLRLKKENIGIELSIVEDELLIDITPSYQKPTKHHICEKEKFHHIMEECDKLNKKEIREKCEKYDEKCHKNLNSVKKHIEDLIDKVEEKDVDDEQVSNFVKRQKELDSEIYKKILALAKKWDGKGNLSFGKIGELDSPKNNHYKIKKK